MEKEPTKFGVACRQRRLAKKMTMTDFAKKIKQCQSYVSGVETGGLSPSLDYILACMDMLEIPKKERPGFIQAALLSNQKINISLEKLLPLQKAFLTLILYTDIDALSDSQRLMETINAAEKFTKRLKKEGEKYWDGQKYDVSAIIDEEFNLDI